MTAPSRLPLAAVVDQFAAAMRAVGLATDEPIRADGNLHRFRVEGDKRGTKNGFYVLHADGIPAGEFGSWKTGITETWRADIGRSLTDAEEEEQRGRVEAARKARAAEAERLHAAARKRAADLWGKASPRVRVTHPYLAAKGVRAYGLRQLSEHLLVPVRDVGGELHGLQFIAADGSKKFGTGTAKAGHYHAVGGAPKPGAVLGIAEGYATAATVHALMGWPVAVAFDAGNLRSVVLALHAKYPAARIVIAADNDHSTAGNPGLSKAREAAAAVGGVVLAPDFAADDAGSDWNDYAAARGAEAARVALSMGVEALAVVAAPEPAEVTPAATAALPTAAAAKVVSIDSRRLPAAAVAAPGKPPRVSRTNYAAGFTVDDQGVWFRGRGQGADAELQPPFFVCPPLRVLALLRDTDSENWGLLLEFEDKDSVTHRWALPWRMFSADGAEMRSELLRLGFFVQPTQKARALFIEYLSQAKPKDRALSVERTGWHGRVFVLPDRTIGEASEPVHFQSESLRDRVYREAGDIADWRSDVADLCRGNSRLVLAVSAAFASILLHWIDGESGGFHFRGLSSSGKTTALRVAASVFGGPEYLRRWRATDNALEAVAAMHNDALLILDELAQVDPKVAGAAAYMLGNGEGKQRAHRGGSARPVLRWRLLFLSAGEISLTEHMRRDGKRSEAGQETRLAEIPADGGIGLGMFEQLHGCADGAAFSRVLTQAAAGRYGTAAPAFIAAILPRLDTIGIDLRASIQTFLRRLLPPKADGQVQRVGARFALVAAAGELASSLGITGWSEGESIAAAEKCFRAWIDQRGGVANIEPARMIAQVRAYLERHGEARFAPWKDDGDLDWITRERAGFRKPMVQTGTLEAADAFYVLREAFRDEMCSGFDHRDVARALADAGMLMRDEKSRKFTRRERLPRTGLTPCYVILPSIWEGAADAESEGLAIKPAGTAGTAGTDEPAP